MWQKMLIDDPTGLGVWKDRLQPIAHLNPDLAILDRAENKNPVILAFLSYPPLLEKFHCCFLNVFVWNLGYGHQGHFSACFPFQIGEDRFELLLGGPLNDSCKIADPPLRLKILLSQRNPAGAKCYPKANGPE